VMVEVGFMLSAIPMPWEPTGVLVADPRTLLHAKLLTALVKLPLLVTACAGVYMGLARYLGIGDLADMPIVGRFFRPAPASARK